MSGQGAETFKKRTGCTDRGKDYEHLYLCTVILNLIADKTIHNFQISSNDASFGAFDDVTIQVEYTTGTKKIYAIQLKHVNKGKTLTKNGLAEKRGNFSVKKYYEDYTQLQKFEHAVTFVLFTNLKFAVRNGVGITLAEDDFEITIEESAKEGLLNTGEKGRCWKFASPGKRYERFFEQFILYTDQVSVDKLRRDAVVTFQGMFGCEEVVFERYLQFVTEWSLVEGKKNKLKRDLMISAIVVRVMAPHIVPFVFSGGSSENRTIWRDVVAKFPVTRVDASHSEKIATVWSDLKGTLDIDEVNKINRTYQVTSYVTRIDDLNDKDCTTLLWLMGLCPLPVCQNDAITKTIDLCNKSFLVFGTTNSSKKTFHYLSDLDLPSRSKIIKNFKCSFQGKEDQTLETLLKNNPNIHPLITTNELVQMLDDSFKLGGKKEILPIPHIDRVLNRNLIKMSFLNTKKNSVVMINNVEPSDEQTIRNSVLDCTLTRVQDFWKRKLDASEKNKNEVILSSGECSQGEIESICRRLNTTGYHLFRVRGDVLEWLQSTGDINKLKEHQVGGQWVEQSVLFSNPGEYRINIVCADPGMGKSILMKTLKNSAKVWTVLLQPKDHSRYFRDKNTNADDFVAYVVDKTYKDVLVRKLVQVLCESRQVMFIWDGLDEVAEENLKVIFQIIQKLSARGFTQWLTSRCNLRGALESTFNVLARTIEQFDVQQQNVYIEKRLNCTGSDLEDIKTKIHKCIRLVQYNDILGIPLQIYMFTELFRQNRDKYRTLLTSIFSITDLYRHFVDEKFNIYHQIKANLDGSNDVMIQVMERSKKDRLKQYEEAALKTYLRPEVLEALKINCDAFLEEIQSGCDSVGIIIDVTDEKIPSFLHNSYGEYFAASFLRKYHDKVPNFSDFVFEESFNNIRFLFDLLMAEQCPAHVAVLYKNPRVLEEHENDLVRRDGGGRNPLHLACSWGKRFSINTSPKDESSEGAKDETPEYQKILNYLITRCDPFEADGLFLMDSFGYADAACSLVPLLVISNTHTFDFTALKNFNDVNTILYNSVKLDYADVFEDIPFVSLGEDKSLLHLAVSHGSVNSVKKMMTNPEYRQRIDTSDSSGVTPFLSACHNGQVKILEVLLAAGADVNATTSNGYNAVYLCARSSNEDVLKFLVDSGVDINARNQFGKTALHLTCESNSYKGAEILIRHGADVDFGDDYGYTPLYLSCRHKDKEIVELLLEKGANVNLANHHGDVPLFMAAWSGQMDVMNMFMERGADIDAVNKKGHGPVHAACLNKLLQVLEFLIENKANVNAPNRFGQTPLHLAVRHHFDEGIVALLKAEADIEAVNKHGETFCEMGSRYYREGVGGFVVKAKGREYWESVKDRVCKIPEKAPVVVPRENTKRCTVS
ncbi:uncharacterized protein LOC135124516 [Zophobas morio]|uniref:uncharacterized protein LOC135124516 n=1 Tax=Zophobas morio TaxID=2755281 RepID=UPI003082C1CE